MDCLFCKIISGNIPADIIAKNDKFLAFKDINPQAPCHILVIPKKHIAYFDDAMEDDLNGLTVFIQGIVKQEGLDNGYRLVINCKEDGGQEVSHLHVHVLGKRKLSWPPG